MNPDVSWVPTSNNWFIFHNIYEPEESASPDPNTIASTKKKVSIFKLLLLVLLKKENDFQTKANCGRVVDFIIVKKQKNYRYNRRTVTERKWYYSAQPRKRILLVATISHLLGVPAFIPIDLLILHHKMWISLILTGERRGLVCIEMPHN